MFATGISMANKVKIICPDSASPGVVVQMNDHSTQRNPAMTSTSRSHPKSFSSFLLTATILTVALLAFEPVAFGQAENPGGDTVSKDISLDLGKGVSMKLVLIPFRADQVACHLFD
jgi:hypothetical protein